MELSKITIDISVLPRGINFVHVNDLKNAALSGAVFPPLIVERGTGRLVDGYHRYTLYKQLYGESYDADVEEYLVPKPRIQQMQHGMLTTADVEVHWHPVSFLLRINKTLVILWIDKSQVIPAGPGPLRHRVGFAASGPAA